MPKDPKFSPLTPLPEEPSRAESGKNPSPETPEGAPVGKKGFLYYVFSPETRLGRFMRPFVRILGAIVTLFAVGFFTAYFALYRPHAVEIQRLKTDLAATTTKLNQTEGTLAAAQKFLNEANSKYEQAAADLAVEKNHRAHLQLLAEINNARAALAQKDGAEARLILQNARKLLDAYLPVIKVHSAEIAASFDTRLNLAQNEFSRDPETALADLELFADNLKDLETVLYK